MAVKENKKISQESPAAALSGSEQLVGVQAGSNVRIGVDQIATFVGAAFGGGGAVASVNARVGAVVLNSADVNLGSVNNTADSAKPVSTAQAAADAATLSSANNTASGALLTHSSNTSNPHAVTPSQLGLGNVNNTSDANKPVSTAQAAADTAVAAVASAALSGHTANVTNPHTTTAAQVGLGNVNNTPDASKPVSTAQQTALDLKANLASPTFTGTVGLPAAQIVNGVTLTAAGLASNFLTAAGTYAAPTGSGGTVTAVSVTAANGITGTVATATTTPAITLALGAITPTTVVASGAVSGSNLSGSNSGDNAANTTYSGLVSNATHTGDATGATALVLATVNANVGSFTNATVTVNAKGLITAASAGSAGVGDMVLASAQTNTGAKTYNAATLLLNNVAGTFASLFTNTNTAARTYTLKDASGTVAFVSDITGTNSGTNTGDQTNIAGNAATVTTNANLTGEVTSAGNAATLTNSAVIAKVLTGYVSGAGTVAATDSILAAVQKLNGNDASKVAKAGDTLTGALNSAATVTVASATTTDIGAAASNEVIVSGITTITGFGTIAAGARRCVHFSGALILTHNATSLILPTGASITTVAGDTSEFVSLGAGNWRCSSYNRASGSALVGGGGSPGGATTQLQYNAAGAFAGMSGTAWDDANRSLAVTGATVTTSNPLLNLTQIWNAGAIIFKGLLLNVTNTASAAASSFLDLQLGGTSVFDFRRSGAIFNGATRNFDISTDAFVMSNSFGNAMFAFQGSQHPQVYSSSVFRWTNSSSATGTGDTGVGRNAPGVAEFNNGTAGAFRDWKARNGILTGNLALGIVAKTASYTVTANDGVIECDATTAAITLTLPAVATAIAGTTYTLKKTDASANAVIWDGNASETIDGATTVQTTTQWASITIIRNTAGTAWLTLKD